MSFKLEDPEVHVQNRTYHILTRYTGKQKGRPVDPQKIWDKYLPHFLEKHKDWCKSIAKPVLEFQNKTWAKFKKEWLHPPYALDIIGLMIWARAYHLQICIVFNYNFWTTQATSGHLSTH